MVRVLNIVIVIKASRHKYQMSQSDLALKGGLPQTNISYIEHGANPTWNTMAKLAKVLDLKTEDLLPE